jgi:Fe2+ transport system protein B
MSVPEGARHDLCTGLVDALGQERAGTLMAYLPMVQSSDQLTKDEFHRAIAELHRRFDALEQRVSDLDDRLSRRVDRLVLTLVTGLFVVVVAMAGVYTATL